MWRQHDFFLMIESQYGRTPPEEADPAGYIGRLEKPGPLVLPAPPLMHGTACWYTLASLTIAGGIVTLTGSRLDLVELLDTIVARQVKGLCIVGDSFARPMLDQLEAFPGRWDLGHLRLIMSSGAMLSRQSKERLVALAPAARDRRRARQLRIGHARYCSEHGRRDAGHGALQARPERAGDRRGRARRRARVRAAGPPRRRRPPARRLLQRPGEDGRHVPHHRRAPARRRRRLGRGGRRWIDHAARSRLRLHQHRRREGLPGGGRGGLEDGSGRRRCGRPRLSGRALRGGRGRRRGPRPRRHPPRGGPDRPRQEPPGELQSTQAGGPRPGDRPPRQRKDGLSGGARLARTALGG